MLGHLIGYQMIMIRDLVKPGREPVGDGRGVSACPRGINGQFS